MMFAESAVVRVWVKLLALLLLIAVSAQSIAQTRSVPPAVQQGVAWLNGQVQADGSLSTERASVATPFQARAVSVATLTLLDTAPPALANSVTAASGTNTEYVARRIVAASGTQQPTGADVSSLLAMQNADGGWGLTANYASDPLDTAFALQAVYAAKPVSSSAVANALGFLGQAKNTDGGWGVNGQSSIYVSAKVLLAANDWSTRYNLGSDTSAARDWLLAQRDATSQTYASVQGNALALRALATQTSDMLVLQPIMDALNGAQQTDGSWANDPYLTAIALNALGFVAIPPATPSSGDVQGSVVDQLSGAAISGATVAMVGKPASTSTAADGSFAFAGVAPGSYTLRVSELGYEVRNVDIQVAAGQLLNLGAIQLVPAPLTASVSGVVKNSNGQLLQNVTISVGTASALTDASGAYQLVGLSPGAATITATLANYQSASASVTFVAGASYLFSPTMYPNNVTPPPTTLQGIIVDAKTQAPIDGASVALAGVTQTTDASGKFNFAGVTAGAFSLAVSATGYQSVTASGSAVAGLNDVGSIALSLQAKTSTLSGVVTDSDTQAPLAGASVVVQGQNLSATSDSNGAYSITGITGTDFTLQASATDYLSQTFSVTLPQAGANTLDIPLTKTAASGISFAFVGMEQPSYAANGVTELKVVIANASAQAASLVISAQALDAQHDVVLQYQANATGLGKNPPNLPVLVPANGGRALEMTQGMVRQAAGHYSVHVQAVDASGRVVAEGDTQFDVSAGAVLAGGLDPDPPLAQIGTQQSIHITADLTNAGNLPISAGNLDVQIVLQNADNQSSNTAQTSVHTISAGTPMHNARGLVTDGAGNVYTVNYGDNKLIKIDASGTASVFATLPQNLGTPALAYGPQGNLWVGGSSSSKVFEVSPQGAVTSITLTSLTSVAGIDTAANGDLLLTGSHSSEQRLVRRDTQGQETVLWRNGLSTPEAMVKDGAGNYVVTNYGDNSLSKISASTGAISAFATGLNRPVGITGDGQGNFYVANNGDNTVAKVTSDGQISTYATGFDQPTDVALDASGNLFVSNQGDNSITKVAPGGTSTVFARGIANGPEGMKYDAAGNLWIANDDGSLRKKDTNDVVTVEATGLSSPRGLAIDAAGNVLVAGYSNGTVSEVAAGTVSTFASGLANPYGVAVAGTGDVYVTERGANRISAFDSAGSKLGVVQSLLDSPNQTVVGANGDVYVNNANSITILESGVPRTLIDGFAARYIAADPVDGGIVAATNYDVYHIADDGTKTHLNTSRLPFYNYYSLGVAADGSVILDDYNNKRLQKLDASGTLSVFATLPDYARTLLTDLAGNIYVRCNNNKFYAIDATGTATQIPVTLSEYMYGFGMSVDGKLLTWTSSNHVYAIDPVTGVATLLFSNPGYTSGIAQDAAGNIYISDTSHQELRTNDASGTLVSTLDGFINPWDIVWTGSEFDFVDKDNRFYSLAPGGYPVKLGSFAAWYLAVANGEVYGTAAGTGIIHWSGTTQETWKTVSGATLNGGIAARADGALSAADNATSRVLTLDASKSVSSDFAGLVRPYGLAFDAQGRLNVSNYGSNTIARFDAGSNDPVLLAKVSSPRHLTFDGAGNLWVSRSGGVDKIDATGKVTLVSNALSVNGLLIDGTQALALDGTNGQLRKLDGQAWNVFATGLSTPQGVSVAANGDIYVANHGNGTVAKYANGSLTTVASGLPAINTVSYFADGNLYAGGNSGLLYQIAPDGTSTSLNVAKAVSNQPFYGVAPGTGGATLDGLTGGDTLVGVTITRAQAPPPPGTVVYQASVPMAAMAATNGYTHFDLAAWLPPYGGDFRIDVSRADVTGSASNFVHIGPAATGALSALDPILPPGDQTEPMCLSLTGADFTSISRVETAQVRPLVSSGPPNGIAADKAGNVYHTDTAALYKTTPQGDTTTIATGLKFSFGLAADSNENLYAASRNASTGHYDLLRFDPAGVQTVVTDLGVTSANGVQVDSHDNILVGSPGKLLKVTQQGQISVVTTRGLPQPRGIAIDGKDNVYVQNEGHYVSLIKPDGSVSDIFTRGDGVNDPIFEGDGYPNIAADCSDNFYIATSRWDKLGKNVQNGEEHTLAQVIPRTGQISLLFDALKISPTLTDIDYLAYDRFGNRILMWNHYYSKIWQVPVTCGAISVDAHVVTPAGQTLTGITVPQSATLPRADGSTEYVWNFRDVTASGAQVCFDTKLHGLKLGETRQTLDSAFVTFQNSFAANDVHEPLAVPDVHVENLVQLAVATDHPDYPAKATAQVTTTLTNANPTEVIGELTVDVDDANGVLVGQVTEQGVTIPTGGTLPVTAPFAVGTILPAQYTVTAVLANNGVTVARATTAFNVLPDNASASATSTVHTDKKTYNATDHVLISSHAQSLSSNIMLSNLTLMVKVYDAGGTLEFTHGYSIAQLLPGSLRAFSIPETLTNAAAGTYTVKQDLLDDQNHAFNHVETTFDVTSTSATGAGLAGTIAATPKAVLIGDPVSLDASASNQGNAALSNLPLTISIIDPGQNKVLQTFDQTSTLAQSASVPFTASWTTQGQVGTTYFAVLSATVGTGSAAKTVTLAQDTFQLTAQIPASIKATGGTPQSATITHLYSQPLQATVLDTANHPLAGISVTFVAPASGAAVTFPSGNTAITDTQGNAAVAVKANGGIGSFVVTATAPGVADAATFALRNSLPVAIPVPLNPWLLSMLAGLLAVLGMLGAGRARDRRLRNEQHCVPSQRSAAANHANPPDGNAP